MTIENLKKAGGKEWQKAGKHRIYFNDLGTWYGLKTEHYNTGNISSATLDGEHISNSSARRILARLGWAKVYYDVAEGKFRGQGFERDEDFDKIVKAIRAKVAEYEKE